MTTLIDMISNNKTTNAFVKEDNIELVWNIIVNNPAFKTSIETNGSEGKQKLRSYYLQHVRIFVEDNIYNTSNIVNFNKKFIGYFIKGFQSPNLDDSRANNDNINEGGNVVSAAKLSIDSSSDLGKNAITIEEIKNERLSEFENRYQKIQTDFDVYRKSEVPEGIDFSEKKRDAPIKDVELTQQITNTSEERKIQEVEISEKTASDPEKALKWLNLKEPPKGLIPEPTIFDRPPPQTNKDKHTNKNDLISNDSNSNNSVVMKKNSNNEDVPVMLVKNAPTSEPTSAPTTDINKREIKHLHDMVIVFRNKTNILSKKVTQLTDKIVELETKFENLSNPTETQIAVKEPDNSENVSKE